MTETGPNRQIRNAIACTLFHEMQPEKITSKNLLMEKKMFSFARFMIVLQDTYS